MHLSNPPREAEPARVGTALGFRPAVQTRTAAELQHGIDQHHCYSPAQLVFPSSLRRQVTHVLGPFETEPLQQALVRPAGAVPAITAAATAGTRTDGARGDGGSGGGGISSSASVTGPTTSSSSIDPIQAIARAIRARSAPAIMLPHPSDHLQQHQQQEPRRTAANQLQQQRTEHDGNIDVDAGPHPIAPPTAAVPQPAAASAPVVVHPYTPLTIANRDILLIKWSYRIESLPRHEPGDVLMTTTENSARNSGDNNNRNPQHLRNPQVRNQPAAAAPRQAPPPAPHSSFSFQHPQPHHQQYQQHLQPQYPGFYGLSSDGQRCPCVSSAGDEHHNQHECNPASLPLSGSSFSLLPASPPSAPAVNTSCGCGNGRIFVGVGAYGQPTCGDYQLGLSSKTGIVIDANGAVRCVVGIDGREICDPMSYHSHRHHPHRSSRSRGPGHGGVSTPDSPAYGKMPIYFNRSALPIRAGDVVTISYSSVVTPVDPYAPAVPAPVPWPTLASPSPSPSTGHRGDGHGQGHNGPSHAGTGGAASASASHHANAGRYRSTSALSTASGASTMTASTVIVHPDSSSDADAEGDEPMDAGGGDGAGWMGRAASSLSLSPSAPGSPFSPPWATSSSSSSPALLSSRAHAVVAASTSENIAQSAVNTRQLGVGLSSSLANVRTVSLSSELPLSTGTSDEGDEEYDDGGDGDGARMTPSSPLSIGPRYRSCSAGAGARTHSRTEDTGADEMAGERPASSLPTSSVEFTSLRLPSGTKAAAAAAAAAEEEQDFTAGLDAHDEDDDDGPRRDDGTHDQEAQGCPQPPSPPPAAPVMAIHVNCQLLAILPLETSASSDTSYSNTVGPQGGDDICADALSSASRLGSRTLLAPASATTEAAAWHPVSEIWSGHEPGARRAAILEVGSHFNTIANQRHQEHDRDGRGADAGEHLHGGDDAHAWPNLGPARVAPVMPVPAALAPPIAVAAAAAPAQPRDANVNGDRNAAGVAQPPPGHRIRAWVHRRALWNEGRALARPGPDGIIRPQVPQQQQQVPAAAASGGAHGNHQNNHRHGDAGAFGIDNGDGARGGVPGAVLLQPGAAFRNNHPGPDAHHNNHNNHFAGLGGRSATRCSCTPVGRVSLMSYRILEDNRQC